MVAIEAKYHRNCEIILYTSKDEGAYRLHGIAVVS